MKIKSPIVTLLVGALIAMIVTILSVRAYEAARSSFSGAAAPTVVAR